jgi:FkbM family methyltransferase
MAELDIPSTCQIDGWCELIEQYLPNHGYFVEVGAYDGITYSNTWPLAELGWAGLCIEPILSLYERCVSNHRKHPDVQCVQRAISDRNAILPLYTDGMELYTLSDKLARSLHADKYIGNLETMPLDAVLMVHDVPQRFDLLVIDVEGMEPEVLNGFCIEYYQPTMVVIEAHEKNKKVALRRHAPFINAYFKAAMFSKIYSDNINNIYIKREQV